MKFVLSFIFDSSLDKVLLIHKNRPEWQKGKVNGVGGQIELNETETEAIVREVSEEAGIEIPKEHWIAVGKSQGDDWTVNLFTAVYQGDMADARSLTDEKIEWFDVDNLPGSIISNLSWLVPLCRDKLKTNYPANVEVDY